VFDGSGQIAKHVSHTRTDQSSDSEYGVNYWVNDDTTTTYYVHSSVLGGKTIVELNQNGTKTSGYVYFRRRAGRDTAHQRFLQHDRDELHESSNRQRHQHRCKCLFTPREQEPDPLGRDLTNPPDPMLVSEPLGNSLLKDRAMPIETPAGRRTSTKKGTSGGRA